MPVTCRSWIAPISGYVFSNAERRNTGLRNRACAAAVSGIARGLLDSEVQVTMRGGNLRIRWEGEDQPVWMTGPAVSVFEGTIDL